MERSATEGFAAYSMNTILDENGFESVPRLGPIVERLRLWRQEVDAQVCTDSRLEAERIGLANRIDTAIRLLGTSKNIENSAEAS